MKRKVLITSLAFVMLFICSCGVTPKPKPILPPITSEGTSESPHETPPETKKEEYSISYYAVEYGKVVEINPLMYQENGSYPTSYTAGEEIYISPLKSGYIDISPNEDRRFKGWYADVGCSVMYSGKTETDKQVPDWMGDGSGWLTEETYGGFWIKTQGDLVVFAKLECGLWIGPY